jgi:nucleoside-diphosphate kinase
LLLQNKNIKGKYMTCANTYSKSLIIGGILAIIALLGFSFWFFKYSTYTGVERTFAIIKPDAVAAGNSGKIIDRIEQDGFKVISMKKIQLTKDQAEEFYAVHKEKPFFEELVNYMISGPIVVMILEKENAVHAWRDLMGNTNPEKAAEGTLRKLFGTDIGHNAVHGSDAPETAKTEIQLFFPEI